METFLMGKNHKTIIPALEKNINSFIGIYRAHPQIGSIFLCVKSQ